MCIAEDISLVMLTYSSSTDDDYLQNASAILDKLKSYYRQGGESSNLSKLLQDYTQVLCSIELHELYKTANDNFIYVRLMYDSFKFKA